MNHAARILRDELGWLYAAKRNLVADLADLGNLRIPSGWVPAQLAEVNREILDCEAALEGIELSDEHYTEPSTRPPLVWPPGCRVLA